MIKKKNGNVKSKNRLEILFVSINDLFLVPYINTYIGLLDKLNVNYNIVLLSRRGENYPDHRINVIKYNYKLPKFISKVLNFFIFANEVKKYIIKNKVKKVVFLHNLIVFFFPIFIFYKLKGNYVYDIRDLSFEKNILFRLLQSLLIKNSFMTVISSNGYKKFLPPKFSYYTCHNTNFSSFINDDTFQYSISSKKPIQITYIGLIRFHPIALKFISLIKNDSRFHFNVIGVGAFELKEKLRDDNISNVSFIDKFPSIETEKYVIQSDILYNLYGSNSIKLDFALSNKLYLAATYRKPILVFSGTYMATLSSKYNFGILVDKDLNNLTDKILDFYYNLNLNYLNNMCSEFLNVVEDEQNNFKSKFNDFVLRKVIL